VRELRIHCDGEYRVVYVAKFDEAIHVLHAFEKKSRKTPRRDLEMATRALSSVIEQRRRRLH